jgi:Trypsin-like peptidase domain
MANLEDVRKLLPDVRGELFGKPNVVATGVGYKVSAGKQTEELSIICSVETKKTKEALSDRERVPSSIQGVTTDVYPTGPIYALQDPTGRFRPAPGGVSVGHELITAGTLGCWVKKNDKHYILSNNHVLANSNDANIGDRILQPGPYDGGTVANDQIATLTEFIEIKFNETVNPCQFANGTAAILNFLARMIGSKSRMKTVRTQAAENLVDCAIAEPLDPNDVRNEILNIGNILGVADATLGMGLKKSGRTTGFTTGSVQQIDVTSQVSYGTNKTGTFVDQLMAGAMSQGGDSGSAVLNNDNKIVGLLFAGSSNSTIINRIQNVFQALNVSLP